MASSLKLLLTAVVLSVMLHSGSSQSDDWIYTVDQLGDEMTFNCTISNAQLPTNYTPTRWMLPNLTMLDATQDRFEISQDSFFFRVTNINANDLGPYHCMLWSDWSQEWFLIKNGLNMKGPYFEDLWQKYRLNVIIAISACGGFLLIAASLILLYKFRYIAPKEEEPVDPINAFEVTQIEKGQPISGPNGYDNAAYENSHDALKDIVEKYDTKSPAISTEDTQL